MKKEVGSFVIENGTLSGPAKYMREQGSQKLSEITAGEDVVFNASLLHSPDVETGILVAMQTDYAGWLGKKELVRCFR
jgi:hypothetical protein